MTKVIKTNGIFRVPATVNGINRHALSSELVNGYAWVYEDKDGPYSKLLWEHRIPTIEEAFACGANYARNGCSFDEGFYTDEDLSQAWIDGYKSV